MADFSQLSDLRGRAVIGTMMHAPELDHLEVMENALLLLDGAGSIERIVVAEDRNRASIEAALGDRLVRLESGRVLLPGMVDLHVHAPQYPQLGLALDEPLEVWLQKYTFPLEARFADLDFAREQFSVLVEDLLALGTTTALYFATQDPEASMLLANICLEKGQRALVGKVAMDNPEACPPGYRDVSAEDAVAGTRRVIEHIRNHEDNGAGRVLPVVTPRFAPSCTEAALAGLGALSAEYGCHVQTHVSESDWAHGYALDRFGVTDASVLDRFGLLADRTVLAHANFLTDADMDLLVSRGSAVAHCALSNSYFANSVFPLRAALEKQLKVGLGTDISGGPSASMFNACTTTVQVSRMLAHGVNPALPAATRGRPGAAVDLVTAFHLATAGGGKALGLPIGRLTAGYKFDAICIDTGAAEGGIRLVGSEKPRDIFEKLIYSANRANISWVWVDGISVGQSEAKRLAKASSPP